MRRLANLFSVAVTLSTLLSAAAVFAQDFKMNPEHWGKCKATPAVVNPAIVSPLQKIVSLRGDWDFKPDSELGKFFKIGHLLPSEDYWKDKLTVQVPGVWEAQGVGEPGMSETWDCTWDCNQRPINHKYMGGVVYRKHINVPQDWDGSRYWLKIGGVRSEASFWVNGEQVGVINNYCGTYKFDVTDMIQPGQTNEILAFVRNDVPSKKGQMCDYHKFGGFYRDVELEATPQTWIDDVWVQGQISESGKKATSNINKSRIAKVHTTIKTALPKEDVQLSIDVKTLDGKVVASTKQKISVVQKANEDVQEIVIDVPVKDAALWTPEKPNLYVADVSIQNESEHTEHGWTERFGFRKLEVVGNRFYLNGNPYFMRGYGETFIYPLTLVSPADRDVHRKNFAVIKEAGFNETRMHTHCELPEYFEAADEAGVLLQPELPYYTSVTTEEFDHNPLRELQELYRHYRRYVSFALYSAGNEGGFNDETNAALYKWVKENDPDRPYQLQDGGKNTPEVADFCTQPINVWPRGAYDDLPYPFITHEYLNLTIKLDPRLEPLFTGPMPSPVSMERYEARLKELGLTREWGDACIHAAGALQAFWQKEGLESARRDGACDGYNFWNFIDQMVVQGPAYTSQGYLNAFYQVKDGGITPKEFSLFNSPTAILPEFESTGDIYVSGDVVPLNFWIATFDDKPLEASQIEWKLENAKDGKTIKQGVVPFEKMEIGEVKIAAKVDVEFPDFASAAELKLYTKISGSNVSNVHSVWAFPKRKRPSLNQYLVAPEFYDWFAEHYDDVEQYDVNKQYDADKILIAPFDSEMLKKGVAEGRRILSIRPSEGGSNTSLGWWSFGQQLGTAFADSPAFGDFPHNGVMIPSLWFRTMTSDPIEISTVVNEYTPLALGELVDDYSLYVGEKRENNAKILATFGLNLFQDNPESLALLDGFIAYVASEQFASK